MDSKTAKNEPVKGVEIVDLGLYLSDEKILVLADLHIGIEEALVKQGVLVPKFHFKDLVRRVEGIFDSLQKRKKKVKTVVINGDLKHEFGTISDEEWRNTLKMLDLLSKKCEKIVLVRGNHDTILGPIADKRKVMFVDHLLDGDKLICHGDKIPEILGSSNTQGAAARESRRAQLSLKGLPPRRGRPPQRPESDKHDTSQTRGAAAGIKTIIIGHEHPAVSIHEDLRRETYKAFLIGRWKRKNLIVQPSLNPLMEGTDVKNEKLLSPFLKKRPCDFDVYLVADTVYEFGKLKKLYKY